MLLCWRCCCCCFSAYCCYFLERGAFEPAKPASEHTHRPALAAGAAVWPARCRPAGRAGRPRPGMGRPRVRVRRARRRVGSIWDGTAPTRRHGGHRDAHVAHPSAAAQRLRPASLFLLCARSAGVGAAAQPPPRCLISMSAPAAPPAAARSRSAQLAACQWPGEPLAGAAPGLASATDAPLAHTHTRRQPAARARCRPEVSAAGGPARWRGRAARCHLAARTPGGAPGSAGAGGRARAWAAGRARPRLSPSRVAGARRRPD